MTVRFDLRGLADAAPSRRARVFAELAELAALHRADRLEVVAEGEDAFAARLIVGSATRVVRSPLPASAMRVYQAFGEANPAPPDDVPTLTDPLDLGRLADAEQGPAEEGRRLDARLRDLARSEQVMWRIGADWQAEILRRRLGVPGRRILRLPAEARLPTPDGLRSMRLPSALPERYLLCLTPVGAAGDMAALIAAHARLGPAAAPLVLLGVDDERWMPAARRAVDLAGSRGRVLVLRDLDAASEAAAIDRAQAVIAIDRHPAHAVRLRQAAARGRPAALRRHPGHAAWVTGGRWFRDDADEMAEALAAPEPIAPAPATAAQACGPAAWLRA